MCPTIELRLRKYKPLFKGKKIDGQDENGEYLSTQGGWWGLTDKYWMGALVPQQDTVFKSSVNRRALAKNNGLEIRTISDEALVIQPGANVTVNNHIFAGAKRLNVLQDYQKDTGCAAICRRD